MQVQQVSFTNGADTGRRLDEIGWGIFLLMIGGIWLVPGVPEGTWLVGTGILLLALNAIRFRLGMEWSGLSVALGGVALAAGLGRMSGVDLPFFPLLLVVLGVTLILKPLLSQRA